MNVAFHILCRIITHVGFSRYVVPGSVAVVRFDTELNLTLEQVSSCHTHTHTHSHTHTHTHSHTHTLTHTHTHTHSALCSL